MDPNVLAILADAGGRDFHAVQLTLKNEAKEAVLIDPYNLCVADEIKGQLFRIVDGDGRQVPYVGRVYKRGEPDFATFKRLRPGAKITQTCRLDNAYDFSGSTPPYRIQYSVLNMHPDLAYFEIESKPINTAF